MPITQAIYQVIYEEKDIREAIHHMMSNEFKENGGNKSTTYHQSYLLERKLYD